MIKLLVTGSRGLIGRELVRVLTLAGYQVQGFDWTYPKNHPHFGDLLDPSSIRHAIRRCDGVIHLAAISRVAWAERDPELCHDVNVTGTRHLLEAIARQRTHTWLILASSREVYGEPDDLPVREDSPRRPHNHYGRSKLAAEKLLEAENGRLTNAVLRFANVYGSGHDHNDRVIPAFLRAAIEGCPLFVHGPNNAFDFTHVSDVVRGIVLTLQELNRNGRSLPPMHFASGRATTLGELAEMVANIAGSRSRLDLTPTKPGFVSRFVGAPERAEAILDFRCEITLERGLHQLAIDMADPGDRLHAEFPNWHLAPQL